MSKPLLAVVPEYEDSLTRLLVIGQQTRGWSGPDEWDNKWNVDRVASLREVYRSFDRGRKNTTISFSGSQKSAKLPNPTSDPFGFMWLDLLFASTQIFRLPDLENQERLRNVSFFAMR